MEEITEIYKNPYGKNYEMMILKNNEINSVRRHMRILQHNLTELIKKIIILLLYNEAEHCIILHARVVRLF